MMEWDWDGESMKAYETFEHRADIGVRGYGRRVEEALVAKVEEAMRESGLPVSQRPVVVELTA